MRETYDIVPRSWISRSEKRLTFPPKGISAKGAVTLQMTPNPKTWLSFVLKHATTTVDTYEEAELLQTEGASSGPSDNDDGDHGNAPQFGQVARKSTRASTKKHIGDDYTAGSELDLPDKSSDEIQVVRHIGEGSESSTSALMTAINTKTKHDSIVTMAARKEYSSAQSDARSFRPIHSPPVSGEEHTTGKEITNPSPGYTATSRSIRPSTDIHLTPDVGDMLSDETDTPQRARPIASDSTMDDLNDIEPKKFRRFMMKFALDSKARDLQILLDLKNVKARLSNIESALVHGAGRHEHLQNEQPKEFLPIETHIPVADWPAFRELEEELNVTGKRNFLVSTSKYIYCLAI